MKSSCMPIHHLFHRLSLARSIPRTATAKSLAIRLPLTGGSRYLFRKTNHVIH